jgi:outer membrane protein assembly factor BamA
MRQESTILKTYITVMLAILTLSRFVSAQVTKNEDESKKRSFLALPIVLYTSDTGFAGGIAGVKSYHRSNPQSSTIQFNTIYTAKHQSTTSLKIEQFLRDDNDRFNIKLEYQKYPSNYYGIGIKSNNDNPEIYTPEIGRAEFFYEYRFWKYLKLRPSFRLTTMALIKSEKGGVLKTNSVPWSRGRIDAGPGLGFVWDTRDNTMVSSKGMLLSIDYFGMVYQDEGKAYNTLIVDIRLFKNFNRDLVLASNMVFADRRGDVPFYLYSQLGGNERLRGYEEKRFIDRSLFLVQQDVRFPIWWRIGGAAFASVGTVAPNAHELLSNRFRPSYGVGWRFVFNRDDHLVVRVDKAWGEDTDGFYITFGEAF